MITQSIIALLEEQMKRNQIENQRESEIRKNATVVTRTDFDRDERITTVYENGHIDYVTIRSTKKPKTQDLER